MRDLKAGGLFGSGLGHYPTRWEGQYPYWSTWTLVTNMRFPPRITAREFGVAGVSLVFILYGGLIYALFTQIKQVADKQRRLLGHALLLFLVTHAFFPLLRVILALPFPSYQMPFMGYGMQGMILCCITVGLILGLVRNRPAREGITPVAELTAPTPPQVAKPDDAGTATMNTENITKPNVRKNTPFKKMIRFINLPLSIITMALNGRSYGTPTRRS